MIPAYSGRPVEILLVEDCESDAFLTKQVLDGIQTLNRLSIVHDGEEALRFLRREDPHADAPRPKLILLDLNMPRMNGHELLIKLKNDETLQSIPVIMLTTSAAEQDIARSYGLQASCYLTKPVELDEFIRLIRAIEGFWLTFVHYPSNCAA